MKYDENQILRQLSDPKTQRQAFAMIVNHYSEQLYWKIRHIVLNHDDADDVLQNVFIKAWKNLPAFQQKSKLSTWLYRIAINESLDFLRSNKSLTEISTDDNPGVASRLMADEYFDGDELQARLQEAIATLPEVQRAVFNMRYYDDMKYSEISRITGTTEGALKASYHIAVKKIREYFESHD